MTEKYSKALVAQIDLGFAKFNGLMIPDGRYAIAVPQIAELFQFNPNQASRDLKRLLGNDFQFDQAKSELNPKAVNIVYLEDFGQIIRALDKKGNPIAIAFIDAILVESLERRFDNSFGKKVSEEERNARLELRIKRILARHKWTDTLMERHVKLFGTKPSPEQYREWTVEVNKALFNKPHFKCDRDNMEIDEQLLIEQFEFMAVRNAQKFPDISCNELVRKALETF
jgi:hypothetical protein